MARASKPSADSGATVQITNARTSRSEDIRGRQNRYLASMAVRTACFLLAVATDGWLRWLLVVAAFVLPYIAVVVANAGAASDPGGPESFVDDSRPMLGTGAVAVPDEDDHVH